MIFVGKPLYACQAAGKLCNFDMFGRFVTEDPAVIEALKQNSKISIEWEEEVEAKQEVIEDVVEEIEEQCEECSEECVDCDIEALREQYKEKFGNEVSNRYKNDAEWIKAKLA